MDLPLNKFLVAVIVVVAAVLGYRALHPSMTLAADGIDPGFDAQVAEARSSGKPVLLMFSADWCPACRATHAMFARPEVSAELTGRTNSLPVGELAEWLKSGE